jgi:hypothetical protein
VLRVLIQEHKVLKVLKGQQELRVLREPTQVLKVR